MNRLPRLSKRRRGEDGKPSNTWYFMVREIVKKDGEPVLKPNGKPKIRYRKINTKEADRTEAREVMKRELRKIRLRDFAEQEPAYANRIAPIDTHVDAYEKVLETRGLTEKYKKETMKKIRELIRASGCRTIDDLDAQRLMGCFQAIQAEEKRGFGHRVWNHYIIAIMPFSRWCWDSGKAADDPLRIMDSYLKPVDEDRRHPTRPFTREELEKIIAHARTAPDWRGISGEFRAFAYWFAGTTGLRADEMRSLKWEYFELTGDEPSVLLEGFLTKSGETVRQPLLKEVAAAVLAWRRAHPRQVTPFPLHEDTASMIRFDYEPLGIAYHTSRGYATFHSLRDTFGTGLAKAGLSALQVTKLMRLSSPAVAAKYYVDLTLKDRREALDKISGFGSPAASKKPSRRGRQASA